MNKAGGTQGVNQTLTFTTGTWNTGQAITVIALDDDKAIAGTSNITHTTVDANTADEYDGLSENLQLTVTDDDAAIVVSRGSGALALTEGGAETYTVTLKGQPTGPVVVNVTSDDAGAVSAAPGTLTFSATTWNTGQTVTVSAEEDPDENAETATVMHAVNDGASADEFDPAPDVTFTVSVTDNDTPGLVVSATDLTANGVNEGSTATYTLALATLPTGPVTVSSNNADVPADVDGNAGNGAQPTLTYTTASWNTAQAVTVRAGHDDDGRDDAVTWTHDPSGSNYGSVANVELAFTVNDDDTSGATVDTDPGTAALAVSEDGTTTTDMYTVVLDTEPSGPVTVTVTVSDDTTTTTSVNDLDKVSARPGALVFTTGNWDTAHTVTVAGREDVDGDNETVSLAHVATSGDTDYAGVTVADNDAPGFLVSPTGLALTEGASGTYTLRLNSRAGR